MDSQADTLNISAEIEGDSILNAMKNNELLIALEVGGKELSTGKLAETSERLDAEKATMSCLRLVNQMISSLEAVRKAAAWHWSFFIPN